MTVSLWAVEASGSARASSEGGDVIGRRRTRGELEQRA